MRDRISLKIINKPRLPDCFIIFILVFSLYNYWIDYRQHFALGIFTPKNNYSALFYLS